MLDHLWDFFVETLLVLFMPMVCSYYTMCGDLFLNVSMQDAAGFELAGDILLSPVQYIFAGKEAVLKSDGTWEFVQKFDYNKNLLSNSIASAAALPASFLLGGAIKGLSFLNADTRKKYASLLSARRSTEIDSNIEVYRQLGIEISKNEYLVSENYLRRPGDERHLEEAKEGLRDIAKVFNEAKIPWWVDCGTLLGTYRYGGVIPWDADIDLSILEIDFENARKALNRLDKIKYIVQDWSGRDNPNTYFKIYLRKSGHLIDIDCYAIDKENKTLSCIFSMENNIFCFEWWKIRERRFKQAIPFETLFPLKKAFFDGIEVFVPNQTQPFLQRYYGENLAPAKIYTPITNRFEKDLSHPYWQRAYVH